MRISVTERLSTANDSSIYLGLEKERKTKKGKKKKINKREEGRKRERTKTKFKKISFVYKWVSGTAGSRGSFLSASVPFLDSLSLCDGKDVTLTSRLYVLCHTLKKKGGFNLG